MRRTQKLNSTYKLQPFTLFLQTTGRKRHSPEQFRTPYDSVRQFNNTQTKNIHQRRKKIFAPSTIKFQHIQIGSTTDNLMFQDLDKTIFPICFMLFKCGCQNSTIPCERLIKRVSESSINQMRNKYDNLKEIVTKSRVNYSKKLNQFVSILPKQFPEALIPSIQTIVKLEDQLDSQSFSLLVHIFVHAKVDYLAYWLYKQLIDSFFSQYFEIEIQLKVCINTYSKTLSRLLTRSKILIHQLIKQFCKSYGTQFIPMNMFGMFVELFNKIGRQYLIKLLFVLILFLIPKLEVKSNVYEVFKVQRKSIPWERVLIAATHNRIY